MECTEAENMTPSSNTKPWMSDEYNIPVPENEEMWSQRVIDEVIKDLFDELDKNEKE